MTELGETTRLKQRIPSKGVIWLIAVGVVGYAGYSALKAYKTDAISVEVRPVRAGADPEVAALVRVTNTGTSPVLLREVSVNTRTASDCVVKTSKSLNQGDSFDAIPTIFFGFYSASCGRIQTVRVTTSTGSSEYLFQW